ncbi:recombinase family protein [Streptomyces demainii]|uniref:DNA invertase Pin-like site-specific DNA recombinase n=1 Tax=Streptomyces demainii TaxID=588122 RepID=A0ABT9KT31_9ACTN|nr:recombinase family protein [Streptomyces demainii]MDP9611577.1 DNA invertase Pin-like site-specific DNA recombinase [Streptomyces demainii]
MSKTLTSAIDVACRAGRLRAVDYLRVSTEEQAKGYGIAYTGKKTKKYIDKKGWGHVGTYADEGFSGSLEADKRPDLKRLMEAARVTPRPFDVVVVPEGRAIGRTGRAFWRWVWELEDLGVFVAVVADDYDNTTPEGRKKMRRDADYAETEREIIRERTQGGIQEKAESGGHPAGVAPYGWRIEDKGKRGASRLVIDENAAATLRKVWHLMVEEHFNIRESAARLNTLGVASPGGKSWSANSLRRILKGTPVQKSVRIYRNPETASTRRGTKLDADGNPVYGERTVIELDPIFKEEEIARLNAAMARTGRPSFAKNGIHPLSKRFFGLCGKHYTGVSRTATAARAYRCSGKIELYPGSPKCDCSQVDADAMEALVWGEVCKLLGDPERLQSMSEDWVNMAADSRVNHAARIEELDRKIAAQTKAMGAVMAMAAKEAALKDLDPSEAIREATGALGQELAQLQAMRDEAVAWAADVEAAQVRAQDLKELATVARTRLHDMEPADQMMVMALLDVRVTILGEVPAKLRDDDRAGRWFRSRGRVVPNLTDEAWARVEPLLTSGGRGRPSASPRKTLEAVLLKARTGMAWRDLPDSYGSYGTIASAAHRWFTTGRWEEFMNALADMPGTPLPPNGVRLPPVRVEGRVDPRLLISTQATPGEPGSHTASL